MLLNPKSFDIDSMDPDIAPSTGTPVKNGLFSHDTVLSEPA